jgi:hypothetical protein
MWVVCRREQYIGIEEHSHDLAADTFRMMRARSLSERASSASQRII